MFRQIARTLEGVEKLFAHIDKALAVLEAMDECIVARNAIKIVQRAVDRAKKSPQLTIFSQQSSSTTSNDFNGVSQSSALMNRQTNGENNATPLQFQATDYSGHGGAFDDLDWLSTFPFNDNQQALFWTQWAHEIDTLGT